MAYNIDNSGFLIFGVIIPHYHRGGHTVFSADHVGVSVVVDVGIASCLHSVSLMNRWILAELTQIYHWVGEKC